MQFELMETVELFHKTTHEMRGIRLSHFWRGYSTAIFLEFGQLTERKRENGTTGNPVGEMTIGFESDWRMENETSILCGSMSEEEFWEAKFSSMIGCHVESIALYASLPEICLELSGGVSLLSFAAFEGQPDWMLIDRRNFPYNSFGVQDGLLHLEADV